jgi:hypothetical protein
MMLNKNTDNFIFFIDTSAFIRIFRFYPKDLIDPIWDKLNELFLNGKMFSHRFVYDEITISSKKQDLLTKKVKPLRKYFRIMNIEQAEIVSNIIKKFPNLIDFRNEKEQADPWLIAIALLEQTQSTLFNINKKVYIVSEESESKLNRIPAVSKYFNLNHLNLSDFYKLNNWSFKLII